MALARLALLKSPAFLNISATTWDTELELLLASASKTVENYCDRHLELVSISEERHTGRTPLTKRLVVNEWPIQSITSVQFYYSDVWNSESTAYFEVIDECMIYYPKLGQESSSYYGAWPNQPYAIKISYTAGYATYIGSGSAYLDWTDMTLTDAFPVPKDLEYAVCSIAALMWLEGRGSSEGKRGKNSIVIGSGRDAQQLLYITGWPDEVNKILTAYQRPRW
jgi:hypothetical protein